MRRRKKGENNKDEDNETEKDGYGMEKHEC